jgi:hypothetical protein
VKKEVVSDLDRSNPIIDLLFNPFHHFRVSYIDQSPHIGLPSTWG